jgi:hypothetical protein
MTIHVERSHIMGSEPRSTTMCPIARALQEQIPGQGTWCVWLNKAALWPGKSYDLPTTAVDFIKDLLDGKSVKPFLFTLEESHYAYDHR